MSIKLLSVESTPRMSDLSLTVVSWDIYINTKKGIDSYYIMKQYSTVANHIAVFDHMNASKLLVKC